MEEEMFHSRMELEIIEKYTFYTTDRKVTIIQNKD